MRSGPASAFEGVARGVHAQRGAQPAPADSGQPRLAVRFPLHHEIRALVNAPPEAVFAYLDDFTKLSAHMETRSAMMIGSRMHISSDALGGRAIGSRVRMNGRVLGIPLRLDEIVTERDAPRRKAWETVDVRLLVIGPYRLGFELGPSDKGSMLRVFIDYDLPPASLGRLLGRWLAPVYAGWCTKRMALDAARHFGGAG